MNIKNIGLVATTTLSILLLSAQSQAAIYSTPSTGPIASTPYVLGPTSPGKWGNPTFGTGASVTWSLMATGTSCVWECNGGSFTSLGDFMPAGYKTEIEAAFGAWSAVSDISFTEVADSGGAFNAPGETGDIRIGGEVFDGAGGLLAHGYYPPNNGSSAAGDIHFDTGESWNIGSNIDIFSIALHEIGHAIGLAHSADINAIMYPSYFSPYSGLGQDDINGAVYIYGTPATVPAPATALLMLSGLGLLGFSRRSRTQNPISA